METLTFSGLHKFPSACGVDVYDNVVIVTELPENKGTSVTNFGENLANIICGYWGIDPQSLLYIEHYPKCGNLDENFSLVTFEIRTGVFCNPKWESISKAEVEILIGHSYP